MSEQLTVFVRLEGDAETQAGELVAAIRGLESVAGVEAQIEEPERSAVEVIQAITLTITSASGAVAAVSVLVDQVSTLLKKFRGVKAAQVETAEGVREVPLGGAPRNENPAQ